MIPHSLYANSCRISTFPPNRNNKKPTVSGQLFGADGRFRALSLPRMEDGKEKIAYSHFPWPPLWAGHRRGAHRRTQNKKFSKSIAISGGSSYNRMQDAKACAAKRKQEAEGMKGKEELNLDALEFVIGGISSKQLIEKGGPVPMVKGNCMQIQCPKCLKWFQLSSFSDSEFQKAHVDNCTG